MQTACDSNIEFVRFVQSTHSLEVLCMTAAMSALNAPPLSKATFLSKAVMLIGRAQTVDSWNAEMISKV